MSGNFEKACKRCGKPYPVEGVMVCSCHPMFSPNYEPEPPIEFKTEKDCQRFIDWMYVSEVERKIELKDAIEKTKRECEDLHKNDPTPEDIRELMESVEKETVEKTNKRWNMRIEKIVNKNTVDGIADYDAIAYDVLDLLEDKK